MEKPQTRIRKDPYQERKGRSRTATWVARLFLLLLGMTSCLTAIFVLYTNIREAQQGGTIAIEGGSADLAPAERLFLETYLSTQTSNLSQPASSSTTPVSFTIEPGQGANAIAANLAAAGLLDNTDLFVNYLRYYGLDSQLEAGIFLITPPITIPELANTLTNAVGEDVEIRFLEGWRVEEMANYLATTQPANVDADEFLAIVQRRAPYNISSYSFLNSLPPRATLEGFLFPDSYRVPQDAEAAYLVNLMLTTFDERVTPAMRQSFGAQGLTIYEAVTLASIVERETPQVDERPLVAAVFLNRLRQDIHLQADPTVQYAVGFDAASNSWWKSPLWQTDLDLDSPYNTYLYPDLPPGPIANPSLTSLQGVAAPAATNYLFFVADCTNSTPGAHLFSTTYAEHLVNVQLCQ